MENNGLLGVEIELVKCDRYESSDLVTYEMCVVSRNNSEEKKITIKEKYPDNYTIMLNF